jgi:hypothetical protein
VKVNLGIRLSRPFIAERSKTITVFKLSNDGKMELFHKEDEQPYTLHVRGLLNTLRGMVNALYVNITTLLRRISIDSPMTTYL